MDAAPKPVSPSVNGWNAEYLDEQYRRFQEDPASLSPDVRAFFEGFELGMTRLGSSGGEGSDVSGGASHFQHQVDKLIEAYREVVDRDVVPPTSVAVIGAGGTEDVVEIELTDEEKANLKVSTDAVEELLEACKALDSSLA